MADFMATKERKVMQGLKEVHGDKSEGFESWMRYYGPVKLWGYGGRCYQDVTPEELNAELAAEAVDSEQPVA